MSMFFSLRAGAGFPFTVDAGTIWYDFTAPDVAVEPTGTPTISLVPERVAGIHNLEQIVKAYQPLKDPTGAAFTTTPDLDMVQDVPQSLSGVTEIYLAALTYYDPAGYNNGDILRFSTPSNHNRTLFSAQMVGLRMQMVADPNDTGLPTTIARDSGIVTKGVWSVWEFKFVFGSSAELWKDGVPLTLGTNNPIAGSFGAGTPLKVIVGDFLDGKIKHIVLQTGPLTTAAQASIRSFLMAEKP